MRFRVAFLGLCFFLAAAEVWAAEKTAREVYDQLNALRVDPATLYDIESANRIELRRGDVQLSFEQGKLAFLQLFEGRVTGAVFYGRGHILAAPRDPVEKQQMAHFLGAPVLDQDFTSACLRFTDDTASDLLRQFGAAQVSPQPDSAFAARWDSLLATINTGQSLRVLLDSLSLNRKPYFFGALDGLTSPCNNFLAIQFTLSNLPTQYFFGRNYACPYYDTTSRRCVIPVVAGGPRVGR